MKDNKQLIEDFRKSVAEKNKAKLSIMGLVLLTVCFFTFIGWASFNSFIESAVPEISTLLTKRLSTKTDNYIGQVQGAATRVLPVYEAQFQKTLEAEWPKIQQAGHNELEALNKYSQAKWPSIERELQKVAVDQQAVIRSELELTLGKDKGEQIATAYTNAALNQYNNFIEHNFAEHAAHGTAVGINLRKIVEREPEINPNVDMNEAFGLAIEVLGLEWQQLAKK